MDPSFMSWKDSYARALKERASYLQATGQGEFAEALMSKAEAFSPLLSTKAKPEEIPFEWPQPKFRIQKEELLERIEKHRALIPLAKAEEFKEWIQNLEDEDDFEQAMELREEIFDRIWRSWKATRLGEKLLSRPQFESAQGPYNNRTVLEDLLENVAQVDPIWVADFTELYQRMHVWEKILKS